RRIGGAGDLGPRASDVDSRVIVGAADPGAVERANVGGGGPVELARASAVAHLPHLEQLRQAAAGARAQRRGHAGVGVRARAHGPPSRERCEAEEWQCMSTRATPRSCVESVELPCMTIDSAANPRVL